MVPALPSCPQLPAARLDLDWRSLHRHREAGRGEEFYRDGLEYGQFLWERGFAARALLCLDRAFGAELRGDESVLRDYPLPYAATAWMVGRVPPGVFIGNPRVHFQHYADRMNEPRREQRRWRAWACWALVRRVRPEWPGDPRHAVEEPSGDAIAAGLRGAGHPGEDARWMQCLAAATVARDA